MDVEIKCCEEGKTFECPLVEHVVAGFDEVEHGGNCVWEIIAETDAASEALGLV